MSVTELATAESGSYVQIPSKLEKPLYPSDLRTNGIIEWLFENGYTKKAFQIESCGQKAVFLACPNNHRKVVRITCHSEICVKCGHKGSLAHRERYTRVMDRLLWSPVLGYMVFTLPREVSDAMPSKEQLSKIEKEAVGITQENFSTLGCMGRIHLMGAEKGHLHIHVNVLFPITDTNGKGEVPQATLNKVRQRWTVFVNQTFGLDKKVTNVFYKFKTSEIRMRHVIKYVTRAVVDDEKFLSLPNETKHWYLSLAGWHNTRWYGQLANCKYKQYLRGKGVDCEANQEKNVALAKKCPVCGERYRCKKIINVDDILRSQFRQVNINVWIDLETAAVLKNKDSP